MWHNSTISGILIRQFDYSMNKTMGIFCRYVDIGIQTSPWSAMLTRQLFCESMYVVVNPGLVALTVLWIAFIYPQYLPPVKVTGDFSSSLDTVNVHYKAS